MKISTKGRYGLTMMLALAKHYGEGPLSLKYIAVSNGLSDHYLEQLAAPLKKAGLLMSVRGAYGGYMLNREPDKIKTLEIIRVLEGPVTPVENIEEEEPSKQALWMKLTRAIREVLDSTTLEDLLLYDEDQQQEAFMFYI